MTVAATVAALVAVGTLAVVALPAAAAVTAAAGAGAWLALRGDLVWWDLLLVVWGGSLVLTYGFANVGIAGGLPVPVADVAILLLLVRALATERVRSARLVFLLAAAYVAWATLRLAIDYPVWHTNALRDYSTAVEVSSLFVGYWALRRYGLQRFLGLRWIMLACVLYLFLYPLHGDLASISPSVGLQQPIPLLGFTGIGFGAISALFFFVILRPFGIASYALAAAAAAYLFLLQSRGLYIAVLAALLLLVAATRRWHRIRGRLVPALALAAVAASVVFAVAPSGRIGRASPDLVLSQIGTLVGHAGPGAGSIRSRESFYRVTVEELRDRSYRWLVGVGLGPDLAGGPRSGVGEVVRKPHDDYLEALGRLGTIGVVFLVGVIWAGIGHIVRAARASTGIEGRVLWWMAASSLMYAIVAATQPLLAYMYGTVPLFATLGAGLALSERAGRGRSRMA